MRNFMNWLRNNGLVIMLILVVFIFILVINTVVTNKTVKQSPVVPAQGVSTMISAPIPAEAVPAETKTFCFRLDGREDMHLPALMGQEAQSIYPNGLSGYNWSLPATASGREDYGVLEDGQVFVKEDFLLRWGMTSYVEIKSGATSWQAQKMEKVEIDGEIAYIF